MSMPLLEVIIIPQNCCEEEIIDLIEKEEVAFLARKRFLAGEISFDDFLDFLKIASVNVDDFLIVNEENAHFLGF